MIKLLLGTFFANSSGAIAKRVLTALGMGIVSYAAVATALNTVISNAHNSYSGMTGYIAAFAGLGGIGEALGIITAAMVFRVTVTTMSRLTVIPK